MSRRLLRRSLLSTPWWAATQGERQAAVQRRQQRLLLVRAVDQPVQRPVHVDVVHTQRLRMSEVGVQEEAGAEAVEDERHPLVLHLVLGAPASPIDIEGERHHIRAQQLRLHRERRKEEKEEVKQARRREC